MQSSRLFVVIVLLPWLVRAGPVWRAHSLETHAVSIMAGIECQTDPGAARTRMLTWTFYRATIASGLKEQREAAICHRAVRMSKTIYIETTILSFYHSLRSDESKVRMKWTREWWDRYADVFRLTSSVAVIEELQRGTSSKRGDRIALVKTELLS